MRNTHTLLQQMKNTKADKMEYESESIELYDMLSTEFDYHEVRECANFLIK
jgi:hypothetical protein